MSLHDFVALVVGVVGPVLLALVALGVCVALFAWPFLLFSAVRNLADSRRALERIAAAVEAPPDGRDDVLLLKRRAP
jgi:hypothetical protein